MYARPKGRLMNHLLTAGAMALATIALMSTAGCDQRPREKVIERETTVVQDRPVVVDQPAVHPDGDRHEGDRKDEVQGGDRRDSPPPPVQPDSRPGNRQDFPH
jgi:hypothetical protein